jgi:hypothetical protein
VIWQEARASSVRDVLQNPAYAGAYVYGRKRLDPTKRSPAHPRGGVVRQPIDTWEICLHHRYPAYLAWEEFLANQAQLRSNHLNYREELHGVPRKGQARLPRDRAVWLLRRITASALLWSARRLPRVCVQ